MTQSHLQLKAWLILHLPLAPGTCPFVFALEEQLEKCLRGLEPFSSSSHVWDYQKVRVKGWCDPGTVPGSQPLQHPGAWRHKPSPPGVLLEAESPAYPARPHHQGTLPQTGSLTVFSPAKSLVGGSSEQWNPISCWQHACLHPCLQQGEDTVITVPQLFETRDEKPHCERRNVHVLKTEKKLHCHQQPLRKMLPPGKPEMHVPVHTDTPHLHNQHALGSPSSCLNLTKNLNLFSVWLLIEIWALQVYLICVL